MSRILNVESLSTKTYGGVDTDWLEDDDFHIFKFNVPGVKPKCLFIHLHMGMKPFMFKFAILK